MSGWLRSLFGVAPPPPEPPAGLRFDEERQAREAAKALNHQFAWHLNRWEGYMEAVRDGDAWAVVERRTRKRPRLVADPAAGSRTGPAPGI